MSAANLPDHASATPIWREFYEHAILELDDAEMPRRIAEARQAIVDRTDAITNASVISETERTALANALRTLTILEELSARGKCDKDLHHTPRQRPSKFSAGKYA